MGALIRVLSILISISLLGHTAHAVTTTCEQIIVQATPPLEQKPFARVDILTREQAGQLSLEESAAVREVMLKAFYGKYPVLFSLNHLLAYDKAIAKYGVQPPMKIESLPANMNRGRKAKIWNQERKEYRKRLRDFAKRLDTMTVNQRREFAKVVANEMQASVADSYVVPRSDLVDPNAEVGLKRMPGSRRNRLVEIQKYLAEFRRGTQNEAFEELVYRSLTPLSRLAIGDRLMDRVGGRKAYQVSTFNYGQTWLRALSGGAIIGAGCIASACHWVTHDGGDQMLEFFAGIGASGTGFLLAGNFSHVWISETARVPEKLDDAINDTREALVKKKFWREIQGPAKQMQIQPSEIVQMQVAEFKIKDISSDNDYDVNDLSHFGSDLLDALRLIGETHLNINIERGEGLEKITPMIKHLQRLQASPDKLRKEIGRGKFSSLENELSGLDRKYFADIKNLGKIRSDLDLLAIKFDEFIAKIDKEMSNTEPATLKLLEHRRGSLVNSKTFVGIQRSALDLSEAKSMDNLKTIEAIRTILISERTGMAIASDEESSGLSQLAARLLKN
jgi:hypothetical protein